MPQIRMAQDNGAGSRRQEHPVRLGGAVSRRPSGAMSSRPNHSVRLPCKLIMDDTGWSRRFDGVRPGDQHGLRGR